MYKQQASIALLIMACSAGGMPVLIDLLASLKKSIRFSVVVVVHRNNKYQSSLEQMVQQKCVLPVKQAEEKEQLKPGVVYFAPAGYHLLMETDQTFSLDVSEPVHYCRPSIDVTMQSLAGVFKEGLTAILLSGANRDGADGIRAVHQYGGVALVQHPDDAEVPVMPLAAIATESITAIMTDVELKAYCSQLS